MIHVFCFFYLFFYCISSDFSDLPDMTDEYIDLSVYALLVITLVTVLRTLKILSHALLISNNLSLNLLLLWDTLPLSI